MSYGHCGFCRKDSRQDSNQIQNKRWSGLHVCAVRWNMRDHSRIRRGATWVQLPLKRPRQALKKLKPSWIARSARCKFVGHKRRVHGAALMFWTRVLLKKKWETFFSSLCFLKKAMENLCPWKRHKDFFRFSIRILKFSNVQGGYWWGERDGGPFFSKVTFPLPTLRVTQLMRSVVLLKSLWTTLEPRLTRCGARNEAKIMCKCVEGGSSTASICAFGAPFWEFASGPQLLISTPGYVF